MLGTAPGLRVRYWYKTDQVSPQETYILGQSRGEQAHYYVSGGIEAVGVENDCGEVQFYKLAVEGLFE